MIDFVPILQTIFVRVGHERLGLVLHDLFVVVQSVTVRVGLVDRRADGLFVAVGQAVAVVIVIVTAADVESNTDAGGRIPVHAEGRFLAAIREEVGLLVHDARAQFEVECTGLGEGPLAADTDRDVDGVLGLIVAHQLRLRRRARTRTDRHQHTGTVRTCCRD